MPLKNLTLTSPISGFVMERNAFAKQRIMPETALYTVADLSSVWVMADVFEYEAAAVRIGMPATLTLSYLPGRTFRGTVSYILPQVDPATRTLKVRIEFANPDFVLKPDMYGEVEFQTGGGRRLVVPQTAVLNSGDRQVVFVDRGKGYFEPREVKIGARSRRPRRNPERPASRRAHRHLRQLPDRFGKPVEDRFGRGLEMIDRIIEFSARNRFLVFLFVAAAALAGWWSMNRIPLDAIPDLSDTQVIVYSRWDRSPDIVEDQVTYPIVSAMLGAPKVKDVRGFSRFRLLLRLHHLRRRHRHLLGALAHAGVSLEDPAAPAAGRADGTRAGCDRRRLGVSVCAGRHDRQHNLAELRSLQDWFLRYHLQVRAGRGGSRAARRLRAAVSGQRRSQPAARLTAFRSRKVVDGGARRQQRRRRAPGGIHRRASTWCAGAATRGRRPTSESLVAGRQRVGRARSACAMWAA